MTDKQRQETYAQMLVRLSCSAEQQVYIVGMLMSWMRREMEN